MQIRSPIGVFPRKFLEILLSFDATTGRDYYSLSSTQMKITSAETRMLLGMQINL